MNYLYHYFKRKVGPFVSLADLTLYEAQQIQNRLKTENKTFAAQRNEKSPSANLNCRLFHLHTAIHFPRSVRK